MNNFIYGFLLSGSMIIAIGAQNLFLLKHGLKKQHEFVVAFICFLCDFLLMNLGVFFIGSIVKEGFWLMILTIAAVVFLIIYGLNSFKSAIKGEFNFELNHSASNTSKSVGKTVIAALAITLLNPHVYLDTVIVVGGVAAQLSIAEKILFLFGALVASFLWFFSLAYFSRFALKFFQSKTAWRIFDAFVGIFMWFIAFNIALYSYHNF